MSDNESPLEQAAQRAIAAVNAVEIDLKYLAGAAIRRVAALQYPTATRASQAATLIANVEHAACELVGQLNPPALRRLLGDFEFQAQLLAQPLPTPSWDEDLPRWCRNGWTATELSLDRMWSFLDPPGRNSADRIASITENSLTLTSGKTLIREQLGLKPYVKPIQRVTSGPQHMIGQPIPEVARES